ncbi:Gfo/Idh/MocA family oxidoreductase [Domibacillus sp. A3M-37]|uniref:Gfo/Idh/MocA family protein n=1 Tax=Domibacillus sp. A3M-37 TaxID=2962037 RepID=UPI0020B6E63B|nr:Gfo/Idh/MocA family oxidoreductase [Domibacillus sp. A3M-37]MCP3764824.1 Gfo/Idh/MocA family oxidoreductase [Domibacillus sp. A3M-37]
METTKIGIIGCGNISSIYFENLKTMKEAQVWACADLDRNRASAQAEKYDVPHAYSVEELLNDDGIDLVINLTIPSVHAEVCRQVIHAGKHVYVEKPLTADLKDGEELVALAKEKGIRIGCAPDTFLGAGIQTCAKAVQEGVIGRPLSATAFMMSGGHESWHPDPAFYYAQGGGPMYDMGPYYLTALVQLLGPMRRVTGSTSKAFEERIITSEPKNGEKIPVETPTHLTGTIDFQSGAVATIVMSFDIFTQTDYPRIELYGTEGTLRVPDPNTFGGPVLLRKRGETEWKEIELVHQYDGNSRGIGVLDMVYGIQNERKHRANGQLALHVLEAMYGFHEAAERGTHYELRNDCEAPALVPEAGIQE